MLADLTRHYGPIEPLREESSAPADRFRLPDGTVFGIISSTTAPFCRSCDRARLTADGMWYLCLYARLGIDLRARAAPRRVARDEITRADRRRLAGAHRPRRRGAAGQPRSRRAAAGRASCAATRTSRCTPAAGDSGRCVGVLGRVWR